MKKYLLLNLLLLLVAVDTEAAKSLYTPSASEFSDGTYSSSRKQESENCVVYWAKGYGSTAPDELSTSSSYYIDIDQLLEDCEAYYAMETENLKFSTEATSTSLSQYKMIICLSYTTDWVCYGGGYDNKVPALWISPSAVNNPWNVAHEVGHSFQYMTYVDAGGYGIEYSSTTTQAGFRSTINGGGQCIWEQTAQWQAFQSYPSYMFSESINQFRLSHNLAFSHENHRYQSYWFHYYLSEYYDDITTVAQVWKYDPGKSDQDFNQVLMALKGLSAAELYKMYFDYACRCVTWDFDACADYRDAYIGDLSYNYVDLGDGSYQVEYASVPQATGFNTFELDVPSAGTTVTVNFTALEPGCSLADGDSKQYFDNADDVYNTSLSSISVTNYNSMTSAQAAYRGFRLGYVALLSDGTRVYLNDDAVHCTGTGEVTEAISCTIPENTSRLWFVVSPALTTYLVHDWDSDFTDDDQWPYKFSFVNTNMAGVPTLDDRDIADVTFTYDVNLVVDASGYTGTTLKVGATELAKLGTAFQLSMSDIYSKYTSYSSSQSNNTVMFYAAYSDGTLQSSASTASDPGHWFNSSGAVTSWGSSSVAFSECTISSSGISFTIGQYPGSNSAGDQYTICQAFNYIDSNGNNATAAFVFNLNFISSGTSCATLTDIDYEGATPVISASKSAITFEGNVGETYTETFIVTATDLEDVVKISYSGDEGFSLSATEVTVSDAEKGYEVTVTYSPQTAGETSGTIVLSSANAPDVTISITGTATQTMPEYYDLEVGNYGTASMYLDFPVVIPDDDNILSVLYAVGYDETNYELVMNEITGYIPAYTGVVVTANKGTYRFYSTTNSVDAVSDDIFKGVIEDTPVSELSSTGEVFTLGVGNQGYVGFYKYTGDTLSAYKVYMTLDESSEVNGIKMVMGDENATSIGTIENDGAEKREIYDLAGRKVNNPSKGIYIVNGKKCIVK